MRKKFKFYIVVEGVSGLERWLQLGGKNALISYAILKRYKDLNKVIENIKELQKKYPQLNLMLDSGAFSNFTGKANIDIEDYKRFISRPDIKEIFDEVVMLDSTRPAVNYERYHNHFRGTLFVDHVETRGNKIDDHLVRIYKESRKVAFSYIRLRKSDKDTKQTLEHVKELAESYNTLIHALGCANLKIFAYSFVESADAMVNTNKYGHAVLLEHKGGGVYKVKRYTKDELPYKLKKIYADKGYDITKTSFLQYISWSTYAKIEDIINHNPEKLTIIKEDLLKKDEIKESIDYNEVEFQSSYTDLREGIYIPEDIANTSHSFVIEGLKTKQTISPKKEQITYIPHFVSLVGSRARGDYDDNSDWDILIRKQERDEALELLIRRTLGEDKEYHFIYSPYGPHGTYIPLFDLKLIRVKEQKPILIEAYTFRPLKNYTPPKMGSAYSFEEFYDIDELVEKWAKPFLERGMGLYVEKKLNGWRATIHKKDSKVGIFFEGTNDNRDKQFLKLSNLLKEIPEDFILDCEFSAKEVKTKKIIPRKDLAGWGHNPDKTIDIDEFETPSGIKARLSIMLFDIPYLNVDISKEPLKERRKILEDFYKGLPQELKKYIEIVPYFYVETIEDLKKAIQEVSRMEMSEGAVVKSSTSIYLPEEIPSWAKFKKIVEIKVEVMKKLKTKDGRAFNYVVGYLDNGEVKELCKTMNTKVDAEIGDIITLSAEEIIIKEDNQGNISISIQIPRVRDIDLNRKRPDTMEEIIQKGYKGGILQATSELISELKAQKILESREGDTGGDWKADFMAWFEKGTKGKFVLQEHERGLSEKLAKTGRRYSGSENIHCDLRFRILKPEPLSFLVGITLATPSKPNEPNKIVEPDKGKILVVGFKKFQPISWLDVGKGKIDLGGGHVKMKLYGKEFIADINTPGGVGSTKNTWSRFVAIDEGDFEVVEKGNHHILFKFNSKNGFLDGYWVLGGAPLDTKNQNLPKFGNRVWFFQKSAKNSDIIKQEEKE